MVTTSILAALARRQDCLSTANRGTEAAFTQEDAMDLRDELIQGLLKEYAALGRIREKLAIQLEALGVSPDATSITVTGGSGGGGSRTSFSGGGGGSRATN